MAATSVKRVSSGMSSMQQHSMKNAPAQPAEAMYVGKLADKSSFAVSYSADIAADWSSVTKKTQGNGKASAAASLYLTASDSGSGEDTVYDAVSLSDSDNDFETEVCSAHINVQGAHTIMYGSARKQAIHLQPIFAFQLFRCICFETSSSTPTEVVP